MPSYVEEEDGLNYLGFSRESNRIFVIRPEVSSLGRSLAKLFWEKLMDEVEALRIPSSILSLLNRTTSN